MQTDSGESFSTSTSSCFLLFCCGSGNPDEIAICHRNITIDSQRERHNTRELKLLKSCSKLELWTYCAPPSKCLKGTVIENLHISIQKYSEHTKISSNSCATIFFFSLSTHLYLLTLSSEVGRSSQLAASAGHCLLT